MLDGLDENTDLLVIDNGIDKKAADIADADIAFFKDDLLERGGCDGL